MGVLERWEDIRNPSRRGNFTKLDVLIRQSDYPIANNHLYFFCVLMSFKLPPKPSSSIRGNDARFKHDVGGHVGRVTVTRGDSRTHEHSAVDPTAPYPEPAEVRDGPRSL